MALPKISIVTPSYNQGAYLEEALRSVLDQNYPNLEYLVMDGGSTDGSVEIIEKYSDRLAYWRSGKDDGQAAAIRDGFCRCTGEVLAWLNSDDRYESGALHAVGKVFASAPEVDLVYGNLDFVDESGVRLFTAYPVLDIRILRYENRFVPQQAMFWRRALYERVGGVDPALRFAMDFDLVLKFLLAGAHVAKVRRVLASFRVHRAAKSSTIRDVMEREGDEIVSRLAPVTDSCWKQVAKKACYRAMRFGKEPASIFAAIRSRM